MKRRVKQWIAFLLTFMMIFSTGIVAVQAAENTEGTKQEVSAKPELSSKTQDSVVLKAKEGYSYAVKDSDKWKWAEEKQYDRKAGTVTFSGLKNETEYTFASKKSDAEAVKDTDTLKVTTDKSKVQEEKKEPSKDAAPAETKPEETKPAEAKPAESQPQEQPKQEEQPKADSTPAETPKADETKNDNSAPAADTAKTEEPQKTDDVAPADTAKTEEPQKTDDAAPADTAKKDDTQKTDPAPADKDKKDDTQKTDPAPADKDKTDESSKKDEQQNKIAELPKPDKAVLVDGKATDKSLTVTVAANADKKLKYEFELSAAVSGGKTEVKSADSDAAAVFDNLEPDTKYNIRVRAIGDGTTTESSQWSDALEAKTLKAAAEAAAKPELESKTDSTVQLKKVDGVQYACAVGDAELTENDWKDSGLFEKLLPGKSYRFYARKAFNANEQMPSKVSEPLEVTTLSLAAEAPSAPKLVSRSADSITLETVEGQEYAVLQGKEPGKWQTSGTFSGLKANTTYGFVTRKTFNKDEALESKVSSATNVKTVISFSGSSVSGIKENGVYDKNAVLNITAAGNGQDNSKPSVQDTRWVPESWGWSQEKGTWTKSPYTAKMTLKKAGNAELKVVFQLEEYTGNGWTAMKADTKSITVPFRVKEEYTITASVGSGGKISPTGKVKVMEGNDQAFTITPNKGYNVSQVKVDGKVVSVKNNKYTFSEVKANHTISVTFKKAVTTNSKKTSPKTGDENNIAGLLALMAVSMAAAGGVVYAGRKKRKN